MKRNKPMIVNSKGNLEAEIGHLVINAEIKDDIAGWMNEWDGNIEKCIVLWVTEDTGQLKLFGTNMKCLEAIGYLEVAKADLLDYIHNDEDENEHE